MKKILLLLPIVIAIIGCNGKKTEFDIDLKETENETPEGLGLASMDTLIKPQDDFYNFVNGKWMKTAKIPSDRARWGSFDQLVERTDSVSLQLLNDLIKKDFKPGTDAQKVKDLYGSIVDTTARNAAGHQPIVAQLQEIDQISNVAQLQSYLTQQTPYGDNPFYTPNIGAHMKRSNENAVYLGGPSLGMGRDYYQKGDKESNEKLKAYESYLGKLFSYFGMENPSVIAKDVVAFEKAMAGKLLTVENVRNADLQYNPMATAQVDSLVSNINLQGFFNELNIKSDTLILSEIDYIKNLPQFLNEKNLPTIKNYLKANVINGASNLLSTELEQMRFDFYSKELRGIEQMRALDKRALQTVNGTIGQAFGKIYVEDQFPPKAKEKAEEMVQYVIKSFEKHINELKWMSDSTKLKALDKLSKFNVKIGYPDNWKDYSKLEIASLADGGSYYQNMRNINKWNFDEDVAKIGKPVDKTEWFMSPQTVNAYYNPSYNEIVFPAAILQPPFYNFKADAAVNFGGMGAVIGHEISHGFDDSGAKYDGDGNLNNWWTPEDEKAFSQLGDSLAAQYDNYEPVPGTFVNGKFTLGENIGDLGGVSVAFDALEMYLQDNGRPELKDGYTPEQRFFISWATIWRTLATDEEMKNRVKTDSHSPGYFRAIGPLVNVDGFHEAFGIKAGDKMYKPLETRIKIW